MTLTLHGDDVAVEQAAKQLYRLIDVLKVPSEHDVCVKKGKADILSDYAPIEAAEKANANLFSDYSMQLDKV